MDLLDFPPEIFRRIIHCLVSDTGVVESWKLRRVCRTFDQEISENILAIQPKEAFSTHCSRDILRRPENMKHYIAYHVSNPRDVSPEILSKIRRMLEYVIKELEAGDDRNSRSILLDICAGVANTCKGILDFLWTPKHYNDPGRWARVRDELHRKQRRLLGQGMTMHEKIIAAMIMRAYAPLAELLLMAPENLPFSAFEDPMTAAVRLDDPTAISTMMIILDHHKSKRYKRDQLLGSNSTYSIHSAISVCIAKYRADLIDLMLGYLHGYTTIFNKVFHRKWVLDAMESTVGLAKIEVLKSLIQAAPGKDPFHVSSTIFDLACRRSFDTVKTLLEHGHVQLDSDSTARSALSRSIKSGTIAMVRLVVEAGADINKGMIRNRFHHSSAITPLDYAIHLKRYNAITYLIECGATVPPKSTWPSKGKTREALQNGVNNRDKKSK